jgi:hypothetical protein
MYAMNRGDMQMRQQNGLKQWLLIYGAGKLSRLKLTEMGCCERSHNMKQEPVVLCLMPTSAW